VTGTSISSPIVRRFAGLGFGQGTKVVAEAEERGVGSAQAGDDAEYLDVLLEGEPVALEFLEPLPCDRCRRVVDGLGGVLRRVRGRAAAGGDGHGRTLSTTVPTVHPDGVAWWRSALIGQIA
jgi:hypothetical protein